MTSEPRTPTRLRVGPRELSYWDVGRLPGAGDAARLPLSVVVLAENLMRHGDPEGAAQLVRGARDGTAVDVRFRPARLLMHDFSGIPALMDLAALRERVVAEGGAPEDVNPRVPIDFVIDHSVSVDAAMSPTALRENEAVELARNRERYRFVAWAESAFAHIRLIPPGRGICHQVNLEYLARVVTVGPDGLLSPDTVLGTDSHTPMVNGLGVLGWGVGGLEAELVMLGQPVSFTLPPVTGVRLVGRPAPGVTATDVVLHLTRELRELGVVGHLVEFVGPGVRALSVPDRATVSNMAPEYGATAAMFPVDERTLDYLALTRPGEPELGGLVEAYARAAGLWGTGAREYRRPHEIDLGAVEPSVAGPSQPSSLVPLSRVRETVRRRAGGGPLPAGAVALAAITSCTNTSNPRGMIAAGLLAARARERGLHRAAWTKASMSPGSVVVREYLHRGGLMDPLAELGFDVTGFGCMTCAGGSGPLLPVAAEAAAGGTPLVAVLSGNRNFDGRIHREVDSAYLMSPALVVAFALAGRVDVDLDTEPLGHDPDGAPVFLADLWPRDEEIDRVERAVVRPEVFARTYGAILAPHAGIAALDPPRTPLYPWEGGSTYIRRPPFLDLPGFGPDLDRIEAARPLLVLGDRVTTDYISPAGEIPPDSPAARFLREQGVAPVDLNTYGARRGNHEVMLRGAFRDAAGLEPDAMGGPPGQPLHRRAEALTSAGAPLVVLAGRDYGIGSSRDWAAKGTRLLGVRAVLAESFERIHLANLICMGVLPLRFDDGEGVESLGLGVGDTLTVTGIDRALATSPVGRVDVATEHVRFRATPLLPTDEDRAYYRAGGLLPFVARSPVVARG